MKRYEKLNCLTPKDDPKNNPILFLVNKKDLTDSMSPNDVQIAIDLEQMVKGRLWNIIHTSAVTGDGIEEGFIWLGYSILKNENNIKNLKKTVPLAQ